MRYFSSRPLRCLAGLSALGLLVGFHLAPAALPGGEFPAAPRPGLTEDWEAARKKAVEETITALEDLAAFCQKNRAYLERDRAYESLLAFAPDHKKARKTLGWAWDRKAEEWARRREYKPPENKKPEMVDEALERRAQVLVGHRDRILALLRDAEGVTPEQHKLEMALLLRANPDDQVLRDLNGEVKVVDKQGNARWMLKEAQRALETRRAIDKQLRQVVSEVELKYFEIEDWEKELGVEWISRRGSDRVKVYGSQDNGEAERVARHVHAVFDVLPPLVGGDTPAPDEFRVYLMSTAAERDSFVQSYPDVRPADREAFPALASGWLVWGRLGCWKPEEKQRVDSAVRQTISFYLWRSHGITDKQGWIEQGLGLHLTYRVIGSRLSFAVASSDYSSTDQPQWASDIHRDDANFLVLARQMLESGSGPKMHFSLGKNVNSMTTEDLLFAYALGAYLVEGHSPEIVAAILTRCGAGENPVQVLEDVLGHDLPTIETRLFNWLEQVRD